jgi:hypothetical protein
MANERLAIGIIFTCFAPSPTESLAELIEYEINVPAGAGCCRHPAYRARLLALPGRVEERQIDR